MGSSLDNLKDIIAKWKKEIDKRLEELIKNCYEEQVIGTAKYIVENGKRLRGSLAILVSEALGGRAEDAMPAALALELVHAASLSLDDIIDQDLTRRGRPSSWVVHGVGDTVMVSNLLIPHAISLVRVYGFRAVNKVIEVWWEISKGEVWDVHGPPKEEEPLKAYERIIEAKTASLFALASYLGALAAGEEERLEDAWRYGFILGKAYQIADDLMDYSEDNSFSAKLFRRWIESVGKAGVIKRLKELVKEAEELGKLLGEPLDSFPREGVAMLLGSPI
ncbi:hypothetical protein IPA_01670 [Ignicoccus pacificus DSM 13166]|uniref:Polyprenyl synthetase family protein n=1 Tax=Ignicoccus pacificus DSM 13166 TaxID=940294 RepID=A0A977KAI8_9CREN|nr:hypothetical protein IPA_01670 [Ignicoccus pacificus DSM 13166]